MKNFIAVIVIAAALFAITVPAMACTTILVGKDASADGCAYAGRTNDMTEMCSAKPEILPVSEEEGSFEYVGPENGFTLDLQKTTRRCVIVPDYSSSPDLWWEAAFNDAGVGISATGTIGINEKVLTVDPFTETGLSEGNIPRLILPYISSAKEGVLRMGSMIEQYGITASEAVAFNQNHRLNRWFDQAL